MNYLMTHLPLFWFVLGILLIGAELMIPGGFILMLMGLAACTVSLFAWLLPMSLTFQVGLFVIAVFMYTFLLKENLKSILNRKSKHYVDPENEFKGRLATALTAINQESGRVEFKGTQWTARSESEIAPGEEVEIIEQDSITLLVKRKELAEAN